MKHSLAAHRLHALAPALLVTAVLVTVMLGGATAHAQFQSRTIRVSNGINQEHPVGNGVAKMTACLAEKSGGKMKLQAFWGGALGGDLQATQALRVRHAGDGDHVDLAAGRHPAATSACSTCRSCSPTRRKPTRSSTASSASTSPTRCRRSGLVNLAYWENGFRNLTNSQRPVAKVEDFSGLKVRVMQNNIFLDTFKTLGANAVPMAFGEVFPALETKAIDGQENPFVTIDTSKFYEVQKYLSVTRARLHAVHGAVLEDAVGQARRPPSRRRSPTARSSVATSSARCRARSRTSRWRR